MGSFSESYLGQLRQKIGSDAVMVPGVRAVIVNEAGELLLQKRTDFGVWGLFGGCCELAETMEISLIREIQEEAGITINNPVPFGLSTDPILESVEYPNGDQCQYFIVNFLVTQYQGEFKRCEQETADMGWFSVDQLPELLPNMMQAIQDYQQYRETGQFQVRLG